ncbi:MAG: hypothetical protein AAF962_22330 [Actinomycetota bacterium]
MSPDHWPDELAREIRRVNGLVEPVTISDVETFGSSTRNGLVVQGTDDDIDWLSPIEEETNMKLLRHRWAWGLVGAAALVVVAILMLVVVGGDDDLSLDLAEDPSSTTAPRPPERTPLEVVEARYEALNALDFDAVHADVADSATFCFRFLPDRNVTDDCQDSIDGYHAAGGLGDQDETAALRAHSFGGAIDYSCSTEGSTVTCTQQINHLLTEKSGAELQLLTVTYTVADGRVTFIEKLPDKAEGAQLNLVRTEEAGYVAWLRQEYPDEAEELISLDRARISQDAAARHRELVAEWVSTSG